MKQSIKKLIVGVLMIPALALGFLAFAPVVDTVYAAPPCTGTNCLTDGSTAANTTENNTKLIGTDDSIVKQAINWMLYIIGSLSVIMLIVGGVRYVMSSGNEKGVKSAKDTILYAIIGVVVAVLAWSIVNFALNAFTVKTAAPAATPVPASGGSGGTAPAGGGTAPAAN